jgi:EAL domain-containing protein (putative c-di-GMP-specific phosphodiesterase class I)
MYKVKHSGKNNYMFFNEDMLKEIKNRADIVAMLCNALKKDGFRLVYQPMVNTLTGEITGFEALLRLKNNNITPDAFIPVAEDTGLIIEIGRWVAKEAIEQLARWRKNAYQLKPVAINYSNRQLQDDGFNSFLMDNLNANDIDPKYLEIEITESILLNKNGNAMLFLNSIKDMGIHLTLDDFGSGFSSISYLTFLPIYKIKIDKMICIKFLEVESDKVINDMISMLHSLGLEITAEGIEHVEQYQKLKQVGCDYIQGFLFCRPVPVDEIDKIYQYNMLTRLEKKD